MPWKVYHEKRDGKDQYCLHKHVGGKKGALVAGGCHDTPEEARKHQAALYVSEDKEFDPFDGIIVEEEEIVDNSTEDKELTYPDLPAGIATSFAELDAIREYQEKQHDVDGLMSDFQSLVGNIIYTPEMMLEESKVKLLDDLFGEFSKKFDEVTASSDEDESKETVDEKEEKAVWSTEYVNNLPDSSFLYVEPGGKKDGEGKTTPRSLRHLPVKDANGSPDAAHIRNAAARANQVKLKSGGTVSPALAKRLIAKARSMLKRVKKEDIGIIESIKDSIKDIVDKDNDVNFMTVWKEADGSYSWLSTYSNKFMDNDNPPDIIASIAHQNFVEKVDKGAAPLPELWIWHVPEWKVGYATALAYDDAGFPIAIGKFDDDCKEVAEWMSTQPDFGVSHGMWNKSLVRDPNDESVIIEYETYEISPLPRSRAANKLADFVVLSKEKEDNMSIPEEKRDELLKRGLPNSILSALEERNKANAEKANADGIKSKEEPIENPDGQPVPDNKEDVSTEETQTDETTTDETPSQPAVDTAQFPTREEVAEAIATVIAPTLNEMKETITSLQAQVKEMQESENVRFKELISNTPRDSLATLMAQRFVGSSSKSSETVLPKGDDLLKLKPKETKASNNARTGIRFVDNLITPTPSSEE